MAFFPINQEDLKVRGWDRADIILITGDAYIDHPSFGAALLARVLEKEGFKVGIIAQPDWKSDKDFLRLGTPRLFFGVTSGNMDSMVNHYTAQRRIRSDDAYTPGGKSGKRPDRAVLIYTNLLRRLFKGTPVIIGGIEASLRRIAHYDFWQDKIRNSILADSKADLLIYGMAEKPLVELAKRMDAGEDIADIKNIPSTMVYVKEAGDMRLPDADKCHDKATFHEMNRSFYKNYLTHELYQLNGGRMLKHNPPAEALSENQMDELYSLPFENAPHPVYKNQILPAWEQIKGSITSHRGCYGGCNFCAIAIHQGRNIQSRSEEGIIREAKKMSGTITDLGGPSANMYQSTCKLGFPASCPRLSCIYPKICPNLEIDHERQLKLLDRLSDLPKIKHVFIASGIRHDLALGEKRYISAIARKYTGGRLKLAPEHSSDRVLKLMGKPSIKLFERFSDQYFEEVKKSGLKRQIIPYLIVGHPGSTMQDAMNLRDWLRENRIHVEQVQEFTPTPMSISTAMYYTGMDFETGEPIHVPGPGETRRQKELILPVAKYQQRKQRRKSRK
ncbi:MAG TPA: YgiQ family radical SAM protein [Candidatus Cloacimonetes bacterium]|nr:YgiQ family radical SAM protein [Candidatus Cloacimonadota bacterium]